MNKINVKGRLVRNAEVKETANGKIVTFRLADEHRKDGAVVNVQYIDCVVANKNVDAFETLKQGAFVNGDGILKVTATEKDGVWYNNTTIYINRMRKRTRKAAAKKAVNPKAKAIAKSKAIAKAKAAKAAKAAKPAAKAKAAKPAAKKARAKKAA